MLERLIAIGIACIIAVASSEGLPAAAKPFSPLSMIAAKGTRKVNLNTATIQELRTLPGVGELLAQRIVEKRPFRTLEALKTVKGISPELYQRIAPKVTL